MSHPLGTAHPFRTTSAPLDVYSQHRQPIALHVTSTTILAPPPVAQQLVVSLSCVTCLDPLAHAAPRNIALCLYRIVSLCHDACPPVVSPVFSSLGSLASCFGRVWSGLSRRVPRCARRGPVSFLAVVPCRGALIQECPRVGGPSLV